MSNQPSSDFLPVSPNKLQSGKKFAANYAGEHVAGTEFVIGALFVSWGVSTYDIVVGLLIGNFLAVLSWALVTAPIATDTRLTLYSYLEKIAGRGTIKLYSKFKINLVSGKPFVSQRVSHALRSHVGVKIKSIFSLVFFGSYRWLS